MAASAHERILAAVKAALLAPSAVDVGGRVFRARLDALAPDEVPAINIRRSTGTHNEFAQGLDHGYFEFEVDHYVRGEDWETTADALHMQAHAALGKDLALGSLGQSIRCIRTQTGGDSGDEPLGRLVATYQMQALVRIADLTKAVR